MAKYASSVCVAVTGACEGGVFRWSGAEAALASNFSVDAVSVQRVAPVDIFEDLHES